jgi:hypothetical protein
MHPVSRHQATAVRPPPNISPADRTIGTSVGFLGDGINDGPPLKAAPTSVYISADSAVHIAKELADIILLLREIRNIDDLMSAVHVFHAAKISEGRPPPLDV